MTGCRQGEIPQLSALDSPAHRPKFIIVVLNWNGKDDCLECLQSVERIEYPNFEIVVVDNGSTDDSVPAIRMRFPSVTLIETGENLGYAGGNNVGLREAVTAGADYVLLLNNDTVVDPHILRAFLSAAESFPKGGMFSGKVYFYSEPTKIWYAGAKWSAERSTFTHVGYQLLDNTNEFNRVEETDFAQGCALLVSVETINRIGFLEERFFVNYEEIDWSYRARAVGFKCVFVPQAKVWHKISASFGGTESPVRRYFLLRNRLLWGSRHLPPMKQFLMLKRVCVEMLFNWWESTPGFSDRRSVPWLKYWYWSLPAFLRGLVNAWNAPIIRAERFGLRDYLLGRFGYPAETIKALSVCAAKTDIVPS